MSSCFTCSARFSPSSIFFRSLPVSSVKPATIIFAGRAASAEVLLERASKKAGVAGSEALGSKFTISICEVVDNCERISSPLSAFREMILISSGRRRTFFLFPWLAAIELISLWLVLRPWWPVLRRVLRRRAYADRWKQLESHTHILPCGIARFIPGIGCFYCRCYCTNGTGSMKPRCSKLGWAVSAGVLRCSRKTDINAKRKDEDFLFGAMPDVLL